MDPVAILKAVYKTAETIHEIVKDVKANQQQCKRLNQRIDTITSALKAMTGKDLQRSELRKSLNNYRHCIEDCCEFITQFNDEISWFSKIFHKQNYKEEFEELNLRLTQCAVDLNLGINLKQIFDHKLDVSDQVTDLDVIKSKLDEVAKLMAQRQDEQLQCFERFEQTLNQRFNSFKHRLEQDILKRSESLKAKKIAEEDHAFLDIPYYDLVQEKRIGRGAFADVYRGKWLPQDHDVAIKVIRIQYIDERVKEELMNEISVMYRIRYDHVLNIFGACMEPDKYALIVEYMSLGSLYDVLRQQTLQFSWSDRCSIATQMVKGVNYLHKLPKSIIHRDIKSLNILMTEHGKDFLVKIADFGLAKIRHETLCQSSYVPPVGSLHWKAPELFKLGGKHTEASDVYAMGVVLWELATGCEPYTDTDVSMISVCVLQGQRMDIPSNVPGSFAKLIAKAWAHEQQKRPTCQELLNSIKEITMELDINNKPTTDAACVKPKIIIRPRTTEQNKTKFNKWKENGIICAGGSGRGNRLNQLDYPYGIFIDHSNNIFIADCANHRIVEWKCHSDEGQIIAGKNGRGNGNDQLSHPMDVLFDKQNNSLIISDCGNRRLIRCFRQNKTKQQILISDIDCWGLSMDKNGLIYVSDREKDEVRRWKEGDERGTIVAGGNGNGNRRNQLNEPTFIFVDKDDSLYISDKHNHRVMKWRKDAKEGTVVAGGNGQGNSLKQLSQPAGVIVDHLGKIYVADSGNDRVMRWCEGNAEGEIVVGGNGEGKELNQLNYPIGLSFDDKENLYVADYYNNRILKYEKSAD
ncbi:unnamed protein product [Adineta steineri]|uniref:Protein kinase domain-containing protein n=1 Tax=Adineta steineri TaxID=433720 RepID=A0A814JYH8_9BILA|nr:unnamed protein product [Adineta steineri]CAF1044261.1 unnamed protein product [Adineta steineri]